MHFGRRYRSSEKSTRFGTTSSGRTTRPGNSRTRKRGDSSRTQMHQLMLSCPSSAIFSHPTPHSGSRLALPGAHVVAILPHAVHIHFGEDCDVKT